MASRELRLESRGGVYPVKFAMVTEMEDVLLQFGYKAPPADVMFINRSEYEPVTATEFMGGMSMNIA